MNGSSEDRFTELAPLFVLGTLDAGERTAFQAHVAGCAVCQAEVRAFQGVVDKLPLAVEEHPPADRIRQELMAVVAPKRSRLSAVATGSVKQPRRARSGLWIAALPLAAAVLLGVGLWRARNEARFERARAEEIALRLASSEQKLAEMESHNVALRTLLADPQARFVSLAGQPTAASARARVFWNPNTTEAMVTVAGLPAPPPGMAYQVWVITGSTPIPAGVFNVAADGSAVFNMPRLSATSVVSQFAITLEPAAGVPAPTGPMVLAGQVT